MYVIRARDEEGSGENRPGDGEGGEESDEGVIAGTTGLYPDREKRSANLGVILDRHYWGRGYSAERAEAILDVAFDRLGLELVVASHSDGNERSRRAIEKYVDR